MASSNSTYDPTRKIERRVNWLETEISKCLVYDLPFAHLEKEILTLRDKIRAMQEKMNHECEVFNA